MDAPPLRSALLHSASSGAPDRAEFAAERADVVARAESFAAASRAASTRRAYAADLRAFAAWCSARALCSLPASGETVALYLSELACSGRKVAGISRALTAINQAHARAGHPRPRASAAVGEVWKGIRRTLGIAPTAQKAPLLLEGLRAAVAALPATRRGLRDRALLVLGWALGARRGELVALDVEDLRETPEGLEVTIRRSKTDQEAEGRRVGVPFGSNPLTCPVRAVRAWRKASGILSGALFRGVTRAGSLTPHRLDAGDVARTVKRAAHAAGLDARELAAHSLRAGLVTQAAKSGKSERVIMRQTGHRSIAQVRRYIRDADLFHDNAAQGIGL
jgi:site-specific recombinase XerD